MTKTIVLLDVPGTQVTPSSGGAVISGTNNSHDFTGIPYIRAEVDSDLLVAIRLQYSVDDGETWEFLCETPVLNTSASSAGRWYEIPSEARTTVLRRALAVGLPVSGRVRYIAMETP